MTTNSIQIKKDRVRSSTVIQMNVFSRVVLCIYFAISVFEPYLNGILGSITKYYIFFTMFILLYQHRWKLYPTRTSKYMVVWLIIKFVSLLWSRSYATPRLHYLSQIGMVLFLFVLFSYDYDDECLEWIQTTYWLSSGIIGILSLFFSQSYLGAFSARQVLVIAGIELDPNNQAALLMVGICFSLVNLLYQKRWFIPSALILLVNIYGCFLTGSRAALATLIVAAFLCVLLSSERREASAVIGRLLFTTITIIVLFYLVQRLNPVIYNRLFNLQDYTGGSGRTLQWANVWKEYSRDFFTVLFGIGWGSSSIYTNISEHIGVHNTFLTMLCDVGLLGTSIFLIPIVVMGKKLIRKRVFFPIMLIFFQFVPAFFIDAINKRFFWNAVFLVGIYYYHSIHQAACEADTTPMHLAGEDS